MTKQAMGRLADELIQLGYVERSPDPSDQRAVNLNFTKTGRELMLQSFDVMADILIGLIQVTLILLLGHILFRVPIVGSLFDVYLASFIFIGANLSLDLVISTFAQSQFQAMQITFFFFLPSILLSGVMFPFEGMPHSGSIVNLMASLQEGLGTGRMPMHRSGSCHRVAESTDPGHSGGGTRVSVRLLV